MVSGCGQEEAEKEFVARVGTSLLTRDDLESDSSSLSVGFINEWVTQELLFLEAKRRGLLESDVVQSRLEMVKKRMAIEALLQEALYQDPGRIADEEIRSYFESNQAAFKLREDVALVSFVLFDDRPVANTFRTATVRGTAWGDAVANALVDTSISRHILQLIERKYVTRGTLFPGELWKIARTLKKETVSFVLTTDAGYHVLFLHDFRPQGELPDFSYVSDEIRERLTIASRQNQYEDLMSDLRTRFPVEIRQAAFLSDTSSHPSE
jgi:hypothetical protein